MTAPSLSMSGTRKRTAFSPLTAQRCQVRPQPATTEASPRPGGGEAPASGRRHAFGVTGLAGAGRGLWSPAVRGAPFRVADAMASAKGASGQAQDRQGFAVPDLIRDLFLRRVETAPGPRVRPDAASVKEASLPRRHTRQNPARPAQKLLTTGLTRSNKNNNNSMLQLCPHVDTLPKAHP